MLVGKTNSAFLREGEAEYDSRLKHYVNFRQEVIADIKNAQKLSVDQVRIKEGESILKQIQPSDFMVLLDDKGEQFSSVQFATWLQKRMGSGLKTLVFVVGGAYGFSEEVYQRANGKLSLSKMTFTHQMVRLIFKEQLYRAFTILKNEPYHHR